MLHNSQDQGYWAQYRPATSPTKSLFYRYENDGIIVYDSSARIFDEPAFNAQTSVEVFRPRNKLDVIDGDEYGKH
jgi:hypothetical protein